MKVRELVNRLGVLKDLTGEEEIVVRGENVVTGIDSVYMDRSHSDGTIFLAIDLENEE